MIFCHKNQNKNVDIDKKTRLKKRASIVSPNSSKSSNQSYGFPTDYILPNFLEIQKESFQTFLNKGLIQELKKFKIRVPFKGKNQNGLGIQLLFYPELYRLLEPKLTVKQAIYARKTYNSDLYIPIKIVDEQNKSFILDWFCLATIPLMTSNGHFIVNGLPRMIMSQIVRSPGIYFKRHFRSEDPNSAYYTADFIAQRGTWLRLETDLKLGKLWVKMKNEKKISFMNFFQYVSIASPILNQYYSYVLNTRFEEAEKHRNPAATAYLNHGYTNKGYMVLLQDRIRRRYFRIPAKKDEYDPPSDPIYDPGDKIEDRIDFCLLQPANAYQQKRTELFFETFSTAKKYSVSKIALNPIPLLSNKIDWDTQLNFRLEDKYQIDDDSNPFVAQPETIIKNLFEELDYEYKLKLRNIFQDEFTQKDMETHINTFFSSKFFNKHTYNLSLIGRAKLNQTLGLTIPLTCTLLTEYDLLFGALYLVQCATGKKPLSDIDHLMNRKVKPVGELIQNQFAIGLQRFEEFFVDRVCAKKPKKKTSFWSLWKAFNQQVNPETGGHELKQHLSNFINEKPINGAFQEFFGSNPLSQMLDQTNPLAEITHKRRLSCLGIGGVNRQNAGMDIRGIHPTHYGRICPIETPEGQNAGLVNSFTIYARLSQLGYIKTPFYQLYRGFVVREKGPLFFLADQEKGLRIAPGDLAASRFNFLPKGILLPSRKTKLFERVDRSDLEYIGVHPLQMISIATSLIPFLEHDDGNRALMGSNMQRQSVPTLHPTRPIVGTGLESKVLLDVDHVLQAKESGYVSYVDSRKICLYSSPSAGPTNDFDNQQKHTKRLKNLIKEAFGKKKQNTLELKKMQTEPILKKQPYFNSLCTTNNKSFLSFLSLTQFQNLYQSFFQTERAGLMQIFDVMEKQKTYDQQQEKLVQYKNLFLLALKNQPTIHSPQIFLNAAFFALQSVEESTPFSFNKNVFFSTENTTLTEFPAPQSSPFAKSIHLKPTKKILPVLLKGKKTKKVGLIARYFLQKELGCFFDPLQTTWKTSSNPSFFLRTDQLLQNRFQKPVYFCTPETPQILFNALEMNRLQTKICGKWKRKSFIFKPFFCQPKLIKTKNSNSTLWPNWVQKLPTWNSKYIYYKQIVLQKQLFYQNLATRLAPETIETKQMDYFPLNQIQTLDTFGESEQLSFTKTLNLKSSTYALDTIARSNQDTYLLHRPIVQPGQWVEKGDILADNSSSCKGELAIGKNLLVGYTPWEGYNFEDAVLLSDKVLNQELFSSVHVERYEVEVRDTPDGIEEIRPGLPTMSKTTHLDKNGIVKVGTWVTTGDILVGKRTPKPSEDEEDGYQRLLNTILLDPKDPVHKYRDTSLRVPPNVHGWVVHVEVIETIDNFDHITKVKAIRSMIKNQIATEKKEQEKEQKKQEKQKSKSKQKKQEKQKSNPQSQPKLKLNKLTFDNKQTKKVNLKNTKNKRSLKTQLQANFFQKKRPDLMGLYQSSCDSFNFSFFESKNDSDFKLKSTVNSVNPGNNKAFFNRHGYSTATLSDLCKFSPYLTPEINQKIENRIQAFSTTKKYSLESLKSKNRKMKIKKTDRFISKSTVDFFENDLDHPSLQQDYYEFGITKQELLFKNARHPQFPKRVNVYIAEKRDIQVGDKIAGRHGNKGIISNILPEQDMPYLPDGTPLDLVLNPLGVPSRMNVGQIFECLLGLAGSYLHQTYKIQPFDESHGCEASRSLVYSKLYEARIKTKQNWLFDPNFPGKVRLFDGRTGQCFEQPVTVGKAYILKLIHLVDEKIHARSVGPYALVTQQPLRGRSKRGGQRVGEMEVWALEGFGAAYILQELLTLKSDDVSGRSELTDKLLKQNEDIICGPPESFRVLLRELESLFVGSSVYLKKK